MKLILVLLTALGLQIASASSYAQINLTKTNAKLETVLAELEKQTGYNFIYNSGMIAKISNVSLSVKNVTLTEALSKVLENQPLSFTLNGNTVVIVERKQNQKQLRITGTVVDKDNLAIPNVSVMLKGTKVVEHTNIDGKFSINVPDANAILAFSFLGFATTEVKVGNQSNLRVVLKENIEALNEVVVTALGINREEKC
ncbi:STN domain-containing protein, partial [Pedobacter sp.]